MVIMSSPDDYEDYDEINAGAAVTDPAGPNAPGAMPPSPRSATNKRTRYVLGLASRCLTLHDSEPLRGGLDPDAGVLPSNLESGHLNLLFLDPHRPVLPLQEEAERPALVAGLRHVHGVHRALRPDAPERRRGVLLGPLSPDHPARRRHRAGLGDDRDATPRRRPPHRKAPLSRLCASH